MTLKGRVTNFSINKAINEVIDSTARAELLEAHIPVSKDLEPTRTTNDDVFCSVCGILSKASTPLVLFKRQSYCWEAFGFIPVELLQVRSLSLKDVDVLQIVTLHGYGKAYISLLRILSIESLAELTLMLRRANFVD